jgi:hypothetical protein
VAAQADKSRGRSRFADDPARRHNSPARLFDLHGLLYSMENEIPYDISEDVRSAIISLRQSLQKAGWRIGTVHWDDESRRTVKFAVIPPAGGMTLISGCHEAKLADKLRALLVSN